MVKKIVIGALIVVLLGAVGVGAYDVYQGDSTLSLPDANLGQAGQGHHRSGGARHPYARLGGAFK